MESKCLHTDRYGAPWEPAHDNSCPDILLATPKRCSHRSLKVSTWWPRLHSRGWSSYSIRLVWFHGLRLHWRITWSGFLRLLLHDCNSDHAWIKNQAFLWRRKEPFIPVPSLMQLPNRRLPWWLGLLVRYVHVILLHRQWESSTLLREDRRQ